MTDTAMMPVYGSLVLRGFTPSDLFMSVSAFRAETLFNNIISDEAQQKCHFWRPKINFFQKKRPENGPF